MAGSVSDLARHITMSATAAEKVVVGNRGCEGKQEKKQSMDIPASSLWSRGLSEAQPFLISADPVQSGIFSLLCIMLG